MVTYLWLHKSSISDSKSNRKGNNARDKSSTVSNHNTLIDISGLCGEGSHGGGKSSNGSGLLVLGRGL